MICAVNYAEIMVGHVRAGKKGQALVWQVLVQFGIETITVDIDLASRAAAVRARTSLKLPDAFALATAIHAGYRGYADVSLATFEQAVLRAHAELHPFDQI